MLERLFNRLSKKDTPRDTPGQDPQETQPAVNTGALTSYAAQKEEAWKARTETARAEAEASGEPIDIEAVKENIVEALKTVYDPEIPINIYEIGLIYKIEIESTGMTHVDMTLTSPACPVAGILPGEVESKVRSVEGVRDVKLDLVWDPPWSPDRMSDAAKLELGLL